MIDTEGIGHRLSLINIFVYVLVTLVTDLLYAYIDPRISYD